MSSNPNKKTKVKNSDYRKKANQQDRKKVRQYLSEGKYDGLPTEQKFYSNQAHWND